MISFRYHIVSLVAVFLALAVGTVLGAGPLSELSRSGEPSGSAGSTGSTGTDGAEVVQVRAEFGDAFASGAATTLYGDALADRTVNLVSLPGADPDVITALTEQIGAAGGAVNATYAVQPALVDPSEKSLVDTLGSQLMTQAGADAVTEGASTYDRLGQLMAFASSTSVPEGDAATSKSGAVMESLVGAGLVTPSKDAVRRAPLVLVVLGDEPGDSVAGDAILAGLLDGMATGAAGVVVAADSASGESGQLQRIREESVGSRVASVDGVEAAAGQVTGVLALIRALGGDTGQFGGSGSDGAVPLG